MYLCLKEWLKQAIHKLFPETSILIEKKLTNFHKIPFCTKLVPENAFPIVKRAKCLIYSSLPETKELNELPLPTTLQRKTLSNLSGDFFVADKSDGLRLLLFGDKTSGRTYFIDRDFSVGLIKAAVFSDFFFRNGDSLLDGELLEQHPLTTKRPLLFNVFDCVAFHTTNYAAKDYLGRMEGIKNMTKAYREAFPQFVDKDRLLVVNKLVVPAKQIDYTLSLVKGAFRHKENYFTNKGNSYLVDGLVFTPNSCNYPETHKRVMKWKPNFLMSNDFKVVRKNDKLLFLVLNKGISDFVVFTTVELTDFSKEELVLMENNICEMVYAKNKGCWQFLKRREDKLFPNHLFTAISTLTTAYEEITVEEIRKFAKQSK